MDFIAKLIGYLVMACVAVGAWAHWKANAGAVTAQTSPATISTASAAVPRVETTPPAPAPAPRPDARTVYDQTTFVATEDAFVYAFTAKETVVVRLTVDVDGDAPIDLMVVKGLVAKNAYVANAALYSTGSLLVTLLGDDDDRHSFNAGNPFRNALSKQGLYRHYATRWVSLPAGDYSVVLDNTGTFTPTRADAPTRLAIALRDGGPAD